MIRNQTFHERLIPLLVEGLGAQSYLELGTRLNETIGKVKCPRRYGVDIAVVRDPDILHFEMTTDAFFRDCASHHAPYDFVFVDADHSAPMVFSDYLLILPHVSPEGLICLHDTNPETAADAVPGLCGDAWKAARTLWDGEVEAVTLPFHPGLTIVRKRVRWGPPT